MSTDRLSIPNLPDEGSTMKPYQLLLLPVLLVTPFSHSQGISRDFPILKGPYLGQEPPDTTAEIFAEGILNEISMIHGRITFSPDGREVYWSCNAAPVQSRWHMRKSSDGTWAGPEPSFLSVVDSENGLSFSSDGKRVYYHSRRVRPGREGYIDQDIWYRERTEDGWTDPVNLGPPVNTADLDETAPVLARDGTMYFCRETSRRRHGSGRNGAEPERGLDIYCSKLADGEYEEPYRLGAEVNSEYHDFEPAVSPDNTYMVFISNRPGGYSRMMNLYVSFRQGDGTWTESQGLSEILKVENIWFPSITPDGKYLFFCGGLPGSGGYTNSDYYWMDTKVIEALRPEPAEKD